MPSAAYYHSLMPYLVYSNDQLSVVPPGLADDHGVPALINQDAVNLINYGKPKLIR